ncbi:MAG: Pr6Pr family membrane protein [Acidimicrobiales bacterium]
MDDATNAKRYFGGVAALVSAGLVLQLLLSVTATGGAFGTPQGRIVNFFCFFTVQSNVAVAVTHAMLAADPLRASTAFRVMRLVAMLCILVTGIVFHLALADLQELTGWDLVADTILHTLSPLLVVIGWLVFGPRGALDGRVVRLAALPPVAWLGFALVRGSFVQDVNGNDYYAYPFMNVQVHGYAVALFRCALVAALFLGMAYAALLADRRLPGIRSET